jgi:hypothetical protein
VRAVIADMTAIPNILPERFQGPYALAVSPARYAVERGDWKGAAELEVRPSRFAYADAMTYFARALGAARSGPGAPESGDDLRFHSQALRHFDEPSHAFTGEEHEAVQLALAQLANERLNGLGIGGVYDSDQWVPDHARPLPALGGRKHQGQWTGR